MADRMLQDFEGDRIAMSDQDKKIVFFSMGKRQMTSLSNNGWPSFMVQKAE